VSNNSLKNVKDACIFQNVLLFLPKLMRAVYIFLVCFSFLLLRGYHHAYSATHHHKICYSPAQHIDDKRELQSARASKKTASLTNSQGGNAGESFLSVENEDDDQVFTRKFVVLARYLFILAYILVLGRYCSRLKPGLPFWKLFSNAYSDKLILQGILRI
jgi:hypothetical protein